MTSTRSVGCLKGRFSKYERNAESEPLVVPIVSATAAVGEVIYAADQDNYLQSFTLPDLKQGSPTDLRAPVAWGPARIGDRVLVSTQADELLCLDDQQNLVWRVRLADGPLAGRPLATPDGFLLASTQGVVTQINTTSGRTIGRVDLGQPLATGLARFGSRLVLVGHDAAVLLIDMPRRYENWCCGQRIGTDRPRAIGLHCASARPTGD